MTTEILSLPTKSSMTCASKPNQAESSGIKIASQYDSFEQKSRQDGAANEDLEIYTREFRRTQSGQIGALLDDPYDDPPAIVITPSPERLESWRKSQLFWAAADSWNAKVEELKATVKARNLGYNETIKLFDEGYADWKINLKMTDPEAYSLWLKQFGE